MAYIHRFDTGLVGTEIRVVLTGAEQGMASFTLVGRVPGADGELRFAMGPEFKIGPGIMGGTVSTMRFTGPFWEVVDAY